MILELDGVTHRYGEDLAVENVSLGVESGTLVGVLGPSGCGKTTLVRAIAGHLRPTAGRVRLRGVDVTDDPPESRRIGLVFQEPTLYPHMSVAENVAYGVAAREADPEGRDAAVAEHLELVGLADRADAAPRSLSGGQRRRVELARALAPEPDLLVLDEPLSALDRSLRTRLREEIGRLHRKTGVATLFVTHDQTDALALADRLVVMAEGRVAAAGTPRELYESPPTPFVASFLGRSTTVRGTLVGTSPPRVGVGDGELRLDAAATERSVGGTVTLHARPRTLGVRPVGDAGSADAAVSDDESDAMPTRSLRGEVTGVADAGRRYDVRVAVADGEEVVVERTATPPSAGEEVAVELPPGAVTVFGSDFEASGEWDPDTAPERRN
ncbi:ATP-binding cassette domain-containing protein [Halobellus ruber]|uniref:Molybdate/tungstate import ATP-binding protein WtpC n=1 Tax=Halobellus ruber TaxID=2761102 RepID=A0A7J9SEM6_9EURY|nr:ABC transporter ATP-binding protein [Halobellus ruber]